MELNIYDEDTAKTYKISYSGKGTCENLIAAIIDEGINFPDESIILTNGKQLEIGKTYNFINNQSFTLRNRANLEGFAISFNDVTKEKIRQIKVSRTNKGKPWRYVTHGINLYGTCENKKCEAYDKEVIDMKKNIKELDLVKENGKMICPMCKIPCQAKTVGFYKCYYNIFALKYIEDSDENIKSGQKIPNFDKINVSDVGNDNSVFCNGKKYFLKKTEGENIFKFEETNGDCTFIKLIFQVLKY